MCNWVTMLGSRNFFKRKKKKKVMKPWNKVEMNSWEEKNLRQLFKVDLLSVFKDKWEISELMYLKHNYN